MMKKSILSIALLCLVTLFVISGCSNGQGSEASVDKVVVGLDDTFVPMGFTNDEGELEGFDIDLARAVFERAGIEVEFQSIDWAMKETELNTGNIDAIWNGYSITEERKQEVDFSDVYLENRQVIITLADSEIETKKDLAGKVVGVQEASSSLEAVNKETTLVESFAGGEPVLYENNNQALMDLEAGRIDAIVADEILARYYIAQRGEDQYNILEEDFGSEDYGVGVKKGNEELLETINTQIEAMKNDGSFDEIYEKWFGESASEDVSSGSSIFTTATSIFSGVGTTLKVFIVTLLLSIPFGVVIALGRLYKMPLVRGAVEGYILIMRGTPLLLQLIFIFYGLPLAGIVFDRFTAVVIAFGLNYAAYFGEIFRAGISSIDRGQYEAAEVLGLSKWQTFRRIILPQTIKRVLPPVSNEVITLVKDTSLVYVLGLNDMLRVAKIASNAQASLTPLLVVGVFYFIFTAILTKGFKWLEKRYGYYR